MKPKPSTIKRKIKNLFLKSTKSRWALMEEMLKIIDKYEKTHSKTGT